MLKAVWLCLRLWLWQKNKIQIRSFSLKQRLSKFFLKHWHTSVIKENARLLFPKRNSILLDVIWGHFRGKQPQILPTRQLELNWSLILWLRKITLRSKFCRTLLSLYFIRNVNGLCFQHLQNKSIEMILNRRDYYKIYHCAQPDDQELAG